VISYWEMPLLLLLVTYAKVAADAGATPMSATAVAASVRALRIDRREPP
jgi:hypothetical protein